MYVKIDRVRIRYLLWSILAVILSACLSTRNPNSVTSVTDAPSSLYNVTPTDQLPTPISEKARPAMPFGLDCGYVTSSTKRGPTWNDITIGVSTYKDVQAQLAPAEEEGKTDRGVVLFLNHGEDREWWFVEACFAEDKVSALNIYESRVLNLYLEEWRDLYGEPDSTTWADDYSARSVIWAEEGILVVIEEYPYGSARNVIFFSPMPSQDLKMSWLFDALPSERLGHPPGLVLKPTATP